MIPSTGGGLLVKAAELHVPADLELVAAAERDLSPDVLATLCAANITKAGASPRRD